jgi:hypothetical protein
MNELDRAGFSSGVNDAIRALRGLYGGVRTMLHELAGALAEQPEPVLYDQRVKARPVTSRTNPDERFLRTWEGRFYAADQPEADAEADEDDANEDEDIDDDSPKKKFVTLTAGQSLAFVKVVLYHPGQDKGEPHLLCGVLRDCQVAGRWGEMNARRSGLGRVLEDVHPNLRPGQQLVTKASVMWPQKGARTRHANRLEFRVDQPPQPYPLFELRGSEQVHEIAARLKALWLGSPVG